MHQLPPAHPLLAHNLGMFPDLEKNQAPMGAGNDVQPTEPHRSRPDINFNCLQAHNLYPSSLICSAIFLTACLKWNSLSPSSILSLLPKLKILIVPPYV